MWMMGYNEGGQADFNMPDSFNGRKLRPLIPRPLASATTNNPSSTTPCLSRIHGSHDFFTQYHHLAAMAEQSKRSEFINTPQVVVSSRWNPTPEQLRALEELYRRGTRTPSAEQIQHITSQLRRYGKIEGKNVFYWFQNHKARERQKRRRQLESSAPSAPDHDQPLQISISTDHHQNKESLGGSRTVFELEETKNWPPSTNCTSTTLAQESAVSMQRSAKAAECCRTDGWIQFDEEELQQRRNFVEKNATWQMMQLSCPPHPHPHPHPHGHRHPASTYLINTNPSTCTTTAAASTTTNTSTVLSTTSSRDQRLIKTHHDLSIFMEPYKSPSNHPTHNTNSNMIQHDQGCGESQTLQLFPLRSGGGDVAKELSINHKDSELSAVHPYPFFEFLPLKN